jgi:hypothetical protein
MSRASSFLGYGIPKRVVTYTSGSGNFSTLESNSFCRVTLVGGGGGSASASGGAIGLSGGGGATGILWLRLSGTYAYSVGAAGTAAPAAVFQSYWNGFNTVTGYPYGGNGGAGGATTFGGISLTGGGGGVGSEYVVDPPSAYWSSGSAGSAGITTISPGASGSGRFSYYGTGVGSGGASASGAGNPGNAGVVGIIIIEEFGAIG